MEKLLETLTIFIFKILDNMLATGKTIFLNKEKYIIAALLNSAATVFYMMLTVKVVNSNSAENMFAMFVATFIGTLIPGLLAKKSQRERLYIFTVTSDTLESGKEFADDIRYNDIAITSRAVRDKHMNKVLQCDIFCETKEQSKMVEELIRPNFKYNVDIPQIIEKPKGDSK